jgi:hypothetical protein
VVDLHLEVFFFSEMRLSSYKIEQYNIQHVSSVGTQNLRCRGFFCVLLDLLECDFEPLSRPETGVKGLCVSRKQPSLSVRVKPRIMSCRVLTSHLAQTQQIQVLLYF